jgi:hypothetical protein
VPENRSELVADTRDRRGDRGEQDTLR